MIIDQSTFKSSDSRNSPSGTHSATGDQQSSSASDLPGFLAPRSAAVTTSSLSIPVPELDSAPPAYTDEILHSSESTFAAANSNSTYSYAVPTTMQQGTPQSPSSTLHRQAPQQEYPPFEPTFLIATGQYLTRGFPAVPPPSRISPHPFASHDVTETDWLRFLQEVKAAGELSEQQNNIAKPPIVSILPVVGSLTTHLIRQQMKKGKSKAVGNVVDLWNHYFFQPRQIEIVLTRGTARLSGLGKHPLSSTPGWSGDTFIGPVTAQSDNVKGKAREEEDTLYRLFVVPYNR